MHTQFTIMWDWFKPYYHFTDVAKDLKKPFVHLRKLSDLFFSPWFEIELRSSGQWSFLLDFFLLVLYLIWLSDKHRLRNTSTPTNFYYFVELINLKVAGQFFSLLTLIFGHFAPTGLFLNVILRANHQFVLLTLGQRIVANTLFIRDRRILYLSAEINRSQRTAFLRFIYSWLKIILDWL